MDGCMSGWLAGVDGHIDDLSRYIRLSLPGLGTQCKMAHMTQTGQFAPNMPNIISFNPRRPNGTLLCSYCAPCCASIGEISLLHSFSTLAFSLPGQLLYVHLLSHSNSLLSQNIIRGDTLKWIKDFLNNRKPTVVINGTNRVR